MIPYIFCITCSVKVFTSETMNVDTITSDKLVGLYSTLKLFSPIRRRESSTNLYVFIFEEASGWRRRAEETRRRRQHLRDGLCLMSLSEESRWALKFLSDCGHVCFTNETLNLPHPAALDLLFLLVFLSSGFQQRGRVILTAQC